MNPIRKRSLFLDMTAMCDVTMLLLTFFILTSTVLTTPMTNPSTTPKSSSKQSIPQINLLTIEIDSTNRCSLSFNEKDKYIRQTFQSFGKKYTKNYKFGSNKIRISSFKDLGRWIHAAIQVNPALQLAIQANQQTKYPVLRKILDQFKKIGIKRYLLITRFKSLLT